MDPLILLLIGIVIVAFGSVLGYYTRQSIAKRNYRTIEAKTEKKISEAKAEADGIIAGAKERALKILSDVKKEEDIRREELLKTERFLLKREESAEKRLQDLENNEKIFQQKVEKLRSIKVSLEGLQQEAQQNLSRIAELSKEEARKELMELYEQEMQGELSDKMRKLEQDGEEKMEKRAKEILTVAIQKCALSQAQEITTTTVNLPSDEIKGRIIGKEGRNIKALEKMTGVEVIVDETPEVVVISGFDPIRRQIAKIALEKLIKDGRIQPARIEEFVSKAMEEINTQIKEAGEAAVYEVGIVGLDTKIIQLLGRLKFRTSYGQNVLLHSMEVAYLAGTLAAEIGANVSTAKKAGLLHDIGKAMDYQVEGSHVDIGIRILEKFGVEKDVVRAMKSHHEEYPAETIEAQIVQAADQISGARPGARKDTLENYLKRLGELEGIATSFEGVEKAYAIQAGREIRVFVKPEEISDLTAQKMAKDIAKKIQEELKYPGEIKVVLIRENRVIEYAR